MVDRKKTKKRKPAAAESDLPKRDEIEDAEVVAEAPAPDVKDADPAVDAGETSDDAAEQQDLVETDEAADGTAGELEVTEPPEPVESTAASDPDSANTAPPVAEPARSSGGFGGMVLGGVIAALIGAGALYLAQMAGVVQIGPSATDELASLRSDGAARTASITDLADRVDALTGDIAALEQSLGAQSGDTETAIAEGLSALEPTLSGMDERLDALTARLAELEVQPIPEAELPTEVVEAFERQLSDMLADVDTRFEGLRADQEAAETAAQAALDDKLAELSAAQEAAKASEIELEQAARRAAAISALGRIETALMDGRAYAEALAELDAASEIDVPAALRDRADGSAATLDALKDSFPDAARLALTAATQQEAADGTVSPLTAFLRTQLGARSLEPKAGDDADAILSRAEAALSRGDLDLALQEIAALPEIGQKPFAAWVQNAAERRDTLAALAALRTQLDSN